MKSFHVEFTNGERQVFQADYALAENNTIVFQTAARQVVAIISVYNMKYLTVSEIK